ncbi:fatty acyl-CoA hydrolase precursor, medium chain-like [Glandiceps talaboti]
MSWMLVYACILSLLVASDATTEELDLQVETSTGTVLGLRSDLSFMNITYFRGIPYAEPPVGDLRFRKPVKKEPWEGVFNATQFGVSCPQNAYGDNWMGSILPSDEQDEDCLQLNVYAPTYFDPDEPYAVMIWIHGGGYVSGQGMLYESSFLTGFHDVVVVTINYRLGALGFITTTDEHLPGNYGLFDQIEALEWIKENIGEFGGDPDRITIFGESAGGFSCSILSHTHYTRGKNLFHRAISQSGTIYPGILLPNDVAEHWAYELGEIIGCESDTSEELAKCLREIPYEDFVEAQRGMLFVATEDNDIITSPLEDFFKNSEFYEYDVLMGSNSYEATLILPQLPTPMQPYDGLARPVYNGLVGIHIEMWFSKEHQKVRDAAFFQYEHHDDPDNDDIRHEQYVHFFNDLVFLAPTVENARLHAPPIDSSLPDPPIPLPPPGWPFPFPLDEGQSLSEENIEYLRKQVRKANEVKEEPVKSKSREKQGKTYHYVFDVLPTFYDGPSYVYGASHAVEIIFAFQHLTQAQGAPFIDYTALPEEHHLSRQMATYWTNFAKTGNPNEPEGEGMLIHWPEFDNEEQTTMYFTLNMTDANVVKRMCKRSDITQQIDDMYDGYRDILKTGDPLFP